MIGTRPACRALGAAPATIYRRRRPPAPRPARPRARPARALSERERAAVLAELHSERFVDSAPARSGRPCSTRAATSAQSARCTACWPLHGQVRERRDQRHPPHLRQARAARRAPQRAVVLGHHEALGPAKWTYFYLYVILDIFSRYVVGWTVPHRESAELAKVLIAQATEQQQIPPSTLTVHADRGSSMTSKPVAFLSPTSASLKTHSPALHLDDNPYSEAHFKTLKYRPEFPDRFGAIEHARTFGRTSSLVQPPAPPLRDRPHDPGRRPPRPRPHCTPNATRPRAAYARTPERFVRRPPTPPALPAAAWINKPNTDEAAH